jgi:hypothetical protein
MAKTEGDDLRINLKIHKESLSDFLQNNAPQQKSLIHSINTISSDNMKLQLKL